MQPSLSSPPNISDRRLVGVHREHVSNVSSTDFPGHYPGEDHSFSLDRFKSALRVHVTRLSQLSIEFDLVGVDASIANAIRRTLIAEVPTMCIENVYIMNNTSVVQDEVLSHRLGMVPLNVHPDLFTFRESDTPTDRDTLVFKLDVECRRKQNPPSNSRNPNDLYENDLVYAGMLEWDPQAEQASIPQLIRKPPAPTRPKIVLAKMRPGQVISLECHAIKGIGQEHAKWHPVATASYRLHPHITLLKQPAPHLARKFADCFSPGVIKVVNEGTQNAKVKINDEAVRGEAMTREVFRHAEFEDCVKLGRIRDHFLFNIESESAYEPENLVPAAIRVLRNRISVLRRAAEALVSGDDENVAEPDPIVGRWGSSGPWADVGLASDLTERQDRVVNRDSRGVDGDVVMMES